MLPTASTGAQVQGQVGAAHVHAVCMHLCCNGGAWVAVPICFCSTTAPSILLASCALQLDQLLTPATSLNCACPQIAALLEAEYTPEEVAAIGLTPPAELAALLDGLS